MSRVFGAKFRFDEVTCDQGQEGRLVLSEGREDSFFCCYPQKVTLARSYRLLNMRSLDMCAIVSNDPTKIWRRDRGGVGARIRLTRNQGLVWAQ